MYSYLKLIQHYSISHYENLSEVILMKKFLEFLESFEDFVRMMVECGLNLSEIH